MAKCIFEFFHCTGRYLFSPVNDTAIQLCKTMRYKNLNEDHIEFYHNQGYDIELRPRIDVRDTLKKLVVSYEVLTSR